MRKLKSTQMVIPLLLDAFKRLMTLRITNSLSYWSLASWFLTLDYIQCELPEIMFFNDLLQTWQPLHSPSWCVWQCTPFRILRPYGKTATGTCFSMSTCPCPTSFCSLVTRLLAIFCLYPFITVNVVRDIGINYYIKKGLILIQVNICLCIILF